MTEDNIARIAYSMSDVMRELGFSRAILYREINGNRLKTYRVGKRRFCSRQALLDLQSAREAEANSA